MPGRGAILPPAMMTLVLIAAIATPSSRDAYADDCLAQPNGPAPQGQHWYYRIDHANNKRQCWHLGPDGPRTQKNASQVEAVSTAEPSAPPTSRTQPTFAVPPLSPPQIGSPSTPSDASAVPWLMPRLPEQQQPMPGVALQPAPLPQTVEESGAKPQVKAPTPNAANDLAETADVRKQKSAEPRSTLTPPPVPIETNHTFALLMVMLALLAVTGPILHFSHRRRDEREAPNFKPPRWAPVVALNTPTPRVREWHGIPPNVRKRPLAQSIVLDRNEKKPIPQKQPTARPMPPLDSHERLRHALQQLVDRIQTIPAPNSTIVPRSTEHTNVGRMKRAQ